MGKFIIYLFLLVNTITLIAQNNIQPFSSVEAAQFDFWIGEWKLEWKDQSGKIQFGTNSITKILDGCVIEENFDGGESMPLKGKSNSVYNSFTKKWYQTWVDNTGGYLDFIGSFVNDKMILNREYIDQSGKRIMQRMVWYNISKNELDWNWERSEDEGKTWEVKWKIHYTRKK